MPEQDQPRRRRVEAVYAWLGTHASVGTVHIIYSDTIQPGMMYRGTKSRARSVHYIGRLGRNLTRMQENGLVKITAMYGEQCVGWGASRQEER